MSKQKFKLLVGDNAFHGISHLSQQRARDRSAEDDPSNVKNASKLVELALQNGASGFMFSVSETTLSILGELSQAGFNSTEKPDLYAIVPYAYEYVRLATKVGGIPGLAKKVSKEIVFSKNIFSVAPNVIGLIRLDTSAFLKTYIIYELSRIKSAAGKNANIHSILLHEIITDMALALNLDWLFKYYIKTLKKYQVRPGIETRNFPTLVHKFQTWNIDLSELTLVASFNDAGFQMNPSQEDCESALKSLTGTEVIAMSILAAGYLKPDRAISYIEQTPKLSGVVVGVSKQHHAVNTFQLLNKRLNNT